MIPTPEQESILALAPEQEDSLPKYYDPGRVLFILYINPLEPKYRCEVEILNFDNDSSVMWLNEGIGISYWIEQIIDMELDGYYVIEDITGYCSKDYFGEYDEEWYCGNIRRATDQEIATNCLEEKHGTNS